MKRNLEYVRRKYAKRSWHEREAFIQNITDYFVPENKDEMIKKIENEVLEWLHDENGEEVYEFHYHTPDKKNWEILLFTRNDIFIKNCANGWFE